MIYRRKTGKHSYLSCAHVNNNLNIIAVQSNSNCQMCYQYYQYLTPRPQVVFFTPLSPHDALKHQFTSLETHVIFLQLRVLE